MPIWAIAILVLAAAAALRAGISWWKYRGERVVVCPENHQAAGVALDVQHAVGHAMGHSADLAQWKPGDALRLATCSRWPERAGCGQACLSQIQAAPQDCLVRNILSRWYQGKSCAWCGRPFDAVEWDIRKPALRDASGVSLEWTAIPADRLTDTLATAQPVCFACHLANTLVREHPELAIERPPMSARHADK
ncbi:MAG TPA: hypothetical protein VME43_04255 [Bryobacteraceae bacterium]|nr:hypothetical protein [Bryobacteraceae bacterium]